MANKKGGASSDALAARSAAVTSLIAAFPEEFGKFHTEARVARGLPGEPGGDTNEALLERLKKNQERQEKLERQLAMRGVKVDG